MRSSTTVAKKGRDRYFDSAAGEYGIEGPRGIIIYYHLDGGIDTFKRIPGATRNIGDPTW
jgi:hypothetical protein